MSGRFRFHTYDHCRVPRRPGTSTAGPALRPLPSFSRRAASTGTGCRCSPGPCCRRTSLHARPGSPMSSLPSAAAIPPGSANSPPGTRGSRSLTVNWSRPILPAFGRPFRSRRRPKVRSPGPQRQMVGDAGRRAHRHPGVRQRSGGVDLRRLLMSPMSRTASSTDSAIRLATSKALASAGPVATTSLSIDELVLSQRGVFSDVRVRQAFAPARPGPPYSSHNSGARRWNLRTQVPGDSSPHSQRSGSACVTHARTSSVPELLGQAAGPRAGRQPERRHRLPGEGPIGYRIAPRPRPGAGRRDHRIVPRGSR